jgi:hypothetical protein
MMAAPVSVNALRLEVQLRGRSAQHDVVDNVFNGIL